MSTSLFSKNPRSLELLPEFFKKIAGIWSGMATKVAESLVDDFVITPRKGGSEMSASELATYFAAKGLIGSLAWDDPNTPAIHEAVTIRINHGNAKKNLDKPEAIC